MTERLPADDPDPIRDAIESAGEFPVPLDSLVERIAKDPGAAFAPDVLERLAVLKAENPAEFETLRSRLKQAGCRVTPLDKALAEKSDHGGRRSTHADILIDISEATEVFHSPDGTAYADLMVNDHRETWPIRGKGFRRWLTRQFFEQTGGAPGSEALKAALNAIEAKAHFDGPERPVFVRVGSHEDSLYLDLGDDTWRAVKIDASGWQVVDTPPVRFRRAPGGQPLPVPVRGGSIETLRSFLNVKSDQDFVLAVGWILAALRDQGPYPILVLSGEQGSAKSTFAAMLRSLVDPNIAALRALSRQDRDLFIAAKNGHVLAFDNLSGMPPGTSDALCRMSTGGGFAVRQLYTDEDEVLFNVMRPVILNGIEDFVTRQDLADRAVFMTLEPIPEERRRPEAELWEEFEAERHLMLGVLLDAVAEGLRCLPETNLPELPRMADFALWGSACETAFWPVGTFWSAYRGNRDEAVEGVIDADPVAGSVQALMLERTEWTGTATDLPDELSEVAGERIAKARSWPGSPRALSGRLRRAATFLRKIGIELENYKEGRARTRMIRITRAADLSNQDGEGTQPSAASAPSATEEKPNATNELSDDGTRTVPGDADDPHDEPRSSVRANPLNNGGTDAADGEDASCSSPSEKEKTNAGGWRARI